MPESNSSTDRTYVVGRLGRPHGLDGFLGLYVDEADVVYFQPGSTVSIDGSPLVVRAVRRADRGHQVQFENVLTREAAEDIRGSEVHVAERRELSEDEYWPEDLLGLEVRGPESGHLGVVSRVVTGTAQDRLVVSRDGSEFEVPFVVDLVPVVDLQAGYLEIVELPGLI